MQIRTSKVLVSSLLGLMLGVGSASADTVLYSSFGPGTSFDRDRASFFGFDTGQEGDPDTRFARAFAFSPSASSPLERIELALQFPFSFTQGQLVVNLFTSDRELPGNLLESWTGTRTGTGVFEFTSALHPALTSGSEYFLEATTTGMADGLWYFSPKRPGMVRDVARVNNGPWGVGTRDFNTAFRVSGSAAVTPEPASFVLLGSGLGILAMLVRRRSRAAAPAAV